MFGLDSACSAANQGTYARDQVVRRVTLHVGQDIEKGWYGIPARAGSMTDVEMAQRPTLAAQMARLRGFATGYVLLRLINHMITMVHVMQQIYNILYASVCKEARRLQPCLCIQTGLL